MFMYGICLLNALSTQSGHPILFITLIPHLRHTVSSSRLPTGNYSTSCGITGCYPKNLCSDSVMRPRRFMEDSSKVMCNRINLFVAAGMDLYGCGTHATAKVLSLLRLVSLRRRSSKRHLTSPVVTYWRVQQPVTLYGSDMMQTTYKLQADDYLICIYVMRLMFKPEPSRRLYASEPFIYDGSFTPQEGR